MTDPSDPLDSELADYGARWRAGLTPASGPDFEAIASRPTARRRIVGIAAVAATVATALVVPFALIHNTNSAPISPAGRVLCQVALPKSVSSSIAAQWAVPVIGQLFPFQSTATGDWTAGQVRTKSFFGVALINPRTRQIQPIEAFRSHQDHAAGAYDGNVLVWKEFPAAGSYDDFAVKEWSKTTGRISTVGGSRRSNTSTQSYPESADPVLGGDYAAWIETTDMQGHGDLVVLDTKTLTKRTFSHAWPAGTPMIYEGSLIWTERTNAGKAQRLVAKSLVSGHDSALPTAFAGHSDAATYSTDGRAIAITTPDDQRLYYAPSGTQPAYLVARLTNAGFNPPAVVHGGVVMIVDSDGVLAVNSDGARSLVVHGGGDVTSGGDSAFLIGGPNTAKSLTEALPIAVLAPSAVDLPRCQASRKGGASQPSGACPAGALKIGRGPQLSPATGEHGIILSVTSVAPPCTITGYPTITMQDRTGSPIHFTYVLGQGQYVTHRPPHAVTVGAGREAYFLVAKYRCDTGSTISAAGMTVVLPGQGTMTSVPTAWLNSDVLSFDFCSGGQEPDPGNSVEVSPFESAVNLVGQ